MLDNEAMAFRLQADRIMARREALEETKRPPGATRHRTVHSAFLTKPDADGVQRLLFVDLHTVTGRRAIRPPEGVTLKDFLREAVAAGSISEDDLVYVNVSGTEWATHLVSRLLTWSEPFVHDQLRKPYFAKHMSGVGAISYDIYAGPIPGRAYWIEGD
jgi:hypothetical protein